LRQAAADYFSRTRGIKVEADDVVVGAGAKPFIGYTIQSVTDFGAGDESVDCGGDGVLSARGIKIARDGDRAITALRHDPDAVPLPAAARAALDEIERTRSWNRFRLDAIRR
jgi:hypothetical protein